MRSRCLRLRFALGLKSQAKRIWKEQTQENMGRKCVPQKYTVTLYNENWIVDTSSPYSFTTYHQAVQLCWLAKQPERIHDLDRAEARIRKDRKRICGLTYSFMYDLVRCAGARRGIRLVLNENKEEQKPGSSQSSVSPPRAHPEHQRGKLPLPMSPLWRH